MDDQVDPADGAGFAETVRRYWLGLVQLHDIESPGLTAALAIADQVQRLMMR